jgi:DNA-binding XRE family transcriptional regulator
VEHDYGVSADPANVSGQRTRLQDRRGGQVPDEQPEPKVAMTQAPRYCTRCGGRLARDNRDARCTACSHAPPDTLLRPLSVSREFWDTDQMRDALATWHMGRVIFAYRMHPYHGRSLSQEQVGSWLGMTQAQLSRIENGRAPEELTKLVRYAQILGIPSDLLWFKLPDEASAGTSIMGRSPQVLTLPVVVHGQSVLLPIDVDAARVSGLDGLVDELAANGHRSALGSVAHALPTRDLDELEHVAAALDDARRCLDGSVVGYFREHLDRSKTNDGNFARTRHPWRYLPART